MASKKPRESKPESRRESISGHASDWQRQFVKHFELNFLDASRSLPPEAGVPEYQHATIRAVLQTLLDAGLSSESVVESIGQVLIEGRSGSVQWNAEMNRRRFELIDREIQESLTPAEKVELAGLTRITRAELDSEANLPMAGGKALHRKLLELDVTDKPR